MSIFSDEGQMRAACVMRDAAELNERTAGRIEEAVRQMQIIFDMSYGSVAPRLLEKLEMLDAPPSRGVQLENQLKGRAG